MSLECFSEGICFIPVFSLSSSSSPDFPNLKKETAVLIWEVLQKWTWDSAISFFIIILLYTTCPEITQKIRSLQESSLKIIELVIKFLLGSKINTACAVSLLLFVCSHLAAVQFLIYVFYSVIRLESSFENRSKPPLPLKNMDILKKKTQQNIQKQYKKNWI